MPNAHRRVAARDDVASWNRLPATLVGATLMSDERSSRRPLITRPWTDEEECHCSGIDPAGEAATTRDRCKARANRNRRTKPERQATGRNRFQRADAPYRSGRGAELDQGEVHRRLALLIIGYVPQKGRKPHGDRHGRRNGPQCTKSAGPFDPAPSQYARLSYFVLPVPGAARMPAGPAGSFALPVSAPVARFFVSVAAAPAP